MGFICLMSLLNDDKYKLSIDKKFPTYNILENIFVSIYACLSITFVTLKAFSNRSDASAAQCSDLRKKNATGDIDESCLDTYDSKFYASEELPFDKIRK